MARSDPTTLNLPPFYGTVRQLVIANVAVYFAMAVLGWLAPAAAYTLTTHLWMFGSILEGTYGSRFLREVYFASSIGGAVLAAAVSFTHILKLSPYSVDAGAASAIFGVMVAVAMRMGELEILLWFLVRVRIKYLVAIYVLIDLAYLLKDANAFGALLHLSAGLCAFLYVNYAPTRGLAFAFSEQAFALRNAWYRNKRRRAARKFEVYMGKQGRKVTFDKEGRYLDPDEHKDPNDKRWMN